MLPAIASHLLVCFTPKRITPMTVGQQLFQRIGKQCWRIGRDQEATATMRNTQRKAPDIGRNHGPATCHCFQRNHPKRFVVRGDNHNICTGIVRWQGRVWLRSGKHYCIGNPQVIAQHVQPTLLAVPLLSGGLVRIAPQDHPMQRVAPGGVLFVQQCQCLYQAIHPFQRLYAPNGEQQLPVGRNPQALPSILLQLRLKAMHIYPTGDNIDTIYLGTIVRNHLSAVYMGRSHHAISLPQQFALNRNPLAGFCLFCAAGNQVFHGPQGMKHLHHGDPPRLAQVQGSLARYPVVAMDKVIGGGLAPGKAAHAVEKLRQVGQDLVFVVWTGGARGHMDDSHTIGKRNHGRQCGVLHTGKNIYLQSLRGQFGGKFADIHIHPARFFASKTGKWAAMNTEHSDTHWLCFVYGFYSPQSYVKYTSMVHPVDMIVDMTLLCFTPRDGNVTVQR